MDWICIKDRMPELNSKVLIYKKDKNIQLVGTYLGNCNFHYGDCCQGIQKTCSASHWMLLPESPSEDDDIEVVKNAKDPFMKALSRIQKRHARTIKMLGKL
ncbi:DUF551 domain-containing protein [Candidatus Williamhamiltonella defendens]|nr:DUF551 domain-containing protein [Candidatus Hamiltonella defensa]